MKPFPTTEAELREAGYALSGEGTCRGCGVRIWWWTTPKGKKVPLNMDLKPHWATCPNADDFRKKP